MSYKYFKENIIGIRKMKWDELWHVLYMIKGKLHWDRVTKNEALKIKT